MFSMMLFIFFCFFGLLAVLYHLLRRQEKFCQALRDEHAQTRVLLRELTARLDAPDQGRPAQATALPAPGLAPPAADPLLRLSFDAPEQKPAPPATDPALDLHFDPAVDMPR